MPNAHLEVSDVNNSNAKFNIMPNVVFNGTDSLGTGVDLFLPKDHRQDSVSFTLTWTNLSGAMYQGKPITKIVSHFSLENIKGYDKVWFQAADNPYYGYSFGGKLTRTMSFYYADGAKVNFTPGTAYLAVASLNNYANLRNDYGIESDTVLSGGTAKGLYKSSVAAHGNSLYANLPNSVNSDGYSYATKYERPDERLGFDSTVKSETNIPLGWDSRDSKDRYYGAGLIELNGDTLTDVIWAKTDGIRNGDKIRGFMWYNQSTVIPPSPSTTVSYHYNVA